MNGKVFLVGAGPGDPELLTLKAARLLGEADVVLIDDLASDDLLSLCPQARVIHVGKRGGCKSTPQAFIEKLLVHEARAGHKVVRLKGGDPSIFGRAGEEIAALEAAGVDYEIVPGISAGLAAAASIGASLTHRDHAQGVAFLTAHGAEGAQIDWRALARSPLTLVVYMGVSRAGELQSDLLEGGMSAETPIIAVENASQSEARTVATTLREMLSDFARVSLKSPAVIVIGEAMKSRAKALSLACHEREAEHARLARFASRN
ncbi:MAG: uroporphyrinogen-III C-methyltransferase [Betaproteobacteria bacterium]|nr:MAG: uroporphyrinogen-III C-methyltransferase [Betaproteobacteria bacterium]